MLIFFLFLFNIKKNQEKEKNKAIRIDRRNRKKEVKKKYNTFSQKRKGKSMMRTKENVPK